MNMVCRNSWWWDLAFGCRVAGKRAKKRGQIEFWMRLRMISWIGRGWGGVGAVKAKSCAIDPARFRTVILHMDLYGSRESECVVSTCTHGDAYLLGCYSIILFSASIDLFNLSITLFCYSIFHPPIVFSNSNVFLYSKPGVKIHRCPHALHGNAYLLGCYSVITLLK